MNKLRKMKRTNEPKVKKVTKPKLPKNIKICILCKKRKKLPSYPLNGNSKDGHARTCKECIKKQDDWNYFCFGHHDWY